jgi:putative transposase
VSRRFVARTKQASEKLKARDLSELSVAALMIDGVNLAEQCCVVALAICADGTKVPRRAVARRHREQDRRHQPARRSRRRRNVPQGGLLVVIDGAKARTAAVRRVFGELALTRRCTLHKRRNVTDHLPLDQRG